MVLLLNMQSKKFIRKEEDFVCEHCGAQISGNGYTNHCPQCLWSKHVDINPGDRASECGGMMRPVDVELKGDKYIITHRCEQCGYEKRNEAAEEDDFDQIMWFAG